MLRLAYRARPASGLAFSFRTTIPIMLCHKPPPRVRYTTGPDRAKPTERAAPNGTSLNRSENGRSKDGNENEHSKNGGGKGRGGGDSDAFHARVWRLLNEAR